MLKKTTSPVRNVHETARINTENNAHIMFNTIVKDLLMFFNFKIPAIRNTAENVKADERVYLCEHIIKAITESIAPKIAFFLSNSNYDFKFEK